MVFISCSRLFNGNNRNCLLESGYLIPHRHREGSPIQPSMVVAKWWQARFAKEKNGGRPLFWVGGKIIKVQPRGPKWALLQSMIALDAAEQIDQPTSTRIVRSIAETIGGISKDIVKQFGKVG